MSFYNKIVENVVLPIGDAVLGTRFMKELRAWRRIQWLGGDELSKLENDRLRQLLEYATTHVKHYRDLGISPHHDPQQWHSYFPILYKRDIKGRIDDFLAGSKNGLVREASSGSSGVQGEVYMTKSESSITQALQTLLWEWAGYRLGSPLLQLGMTPNRGWVKTIKDIVLKTNYQQAFNLQAHEINRALKTVRHDDYVFGGYASGLYAYALFAEKPPKFKSIISWGDKVFPHYRSRLQQTFGAPVFDTYGCTEGFVIAGQCSSGRYHVLSPHVKIEIVDANGREVADGEIGHVLVTRLDGYAMPLIRYYLGDLAVKEPPTKCDCGRSLPILRQIIGRDTDVVKTKSGKMLIVHFFTGILEHFPAIRQFRIVQENLDSFVIEYIPEPSLFQTEVLETVRQTIQEKAREQLTIFFEEVSEIKPTASGKPQIIKSSIK